MSSKKPETIPPLTEEEMRFIVSTLQQLELRGTAEALTQAIALIDSINLKLNMLLEKQE
jgi:hypothetical protein